MSPSGRSSDAGLDDEASIPVTTEDGLGADWLAPGQTLAGRYVVERVLGSGGMGTVLAARDTERGQLVALKVMHAEAASDPGSVRRFMREGRAAARLRSEHTARIHEVGRFPSGIPFLVMEYLDGEDLEEIRERRPLRVDEIVDYVLQATKALSEAHAIGLVHRDLKPQNLFLAKGRDGVSRIKVLDFGLAKELQQTESKDQSQVTTDNMLLGSPQFMSPEQVRAPSEVDARSDIWSLGATLYQLFTGEPPFVSATVFGLLARIMADPAPRVRDRAPDVPEAIERVILRCLEKEPDKRFASADELAQALRAAMGTPDAKPASRVAVSSDEPVDEEGVTLAYQRGSDKLVAAAGSPPPPRSIPPPAATARMSSTGTLPTAMRPSMPSMANMTAPPAFAAGAASTGPASAGAAPGSSPDAMGPPPSSAAGTRIALAVSLAVVLVSAIVVGVLLVSAVRARDGAKPPPPAASAP